MKANKTRKLNATIKKVNTIIHSFSTFSVQCALKRNALFQTKGAPASNQRQSDQLLHIEILEFRRISLRADDTCDTTPSHAERDVPVCCCRCNTPDWLRGLAQHTQTETHTQRMHATLRRVHKVDIVVVVFCGAKATGD